MSAVGEGAVGRGGERVVKRLERERGGGECLVKVRWQWGCWWSGWVCVERKRGSGVAGAGGELLVGEGQWGAGGGQMEREEGVVEPLR